MSDGPFLDSPILLLCSERSGSNLLTKVFDAHPDVAAPGPAHLFRIFAKAERGFSAKPEDLVRAILDMFKAKFGDWLVDGLAEPVLARRLAACGDAPAMIASLYEQERLLAGRAAILVKEVAPYAYLPFLLRGVRRPRFLFMVRDPRDMALSWVEAPAMRGGVVRAARQWAADQAGFLDLLSRMGEGHRVARLRYEDLISQPEVELPRVCGQLELTFHPHMLEFSRHSRSAAIEAGKARMLSNIAKPFLSGNSGRHRTGLDAAQRRYVEAVCGPLMGGFGYRCQESLPPHSSDDFVRMEAALVEAEPWEKSAYQDLPEAEKARYARWTGTRDRVMAQAKGGAA